MYTAGTRDPLTAINEGRQIFYSLVDTAREHEKCGDIELALVTLHCAATTAAQQYIGLFADLAVEAMLGRISATLEPVNLVTGTRSSLHGAVHIMSQCSAIGGHTRLVWRWIDAHAGTPSNVVICDPSSAPAPPELIAAVAKTGGSVLRLAGTTRERAIALRKLVASADQLVLSTHEDDIVPALALASMPDRPPMILINHADHKFWLGASMVDLVVSLRPAGDAIAEAHRGIPAGRRMVLPVPLAPLRRTQSIKRAKQSIGVDPEMLLMLSVARPHKYEPMHERTLVAALTPILSSRQDVSLLVVGPEEGSDVWAKAASTYGGRVRAAGTQADLLPYYEAADLYLDSYPYPSMTSALEAGSLGTPVVGLVLDVRVPLLVNDATALEGNIFTEEVAYQTRVRDLLDDENLRTQTGRMLAQSIAAVHCGAHWVALLHESAERARQSLLQRAEKVARDGVPADAQPSTPPDLWARYLDDREGSDPLWLQILERLTDVEKGRTRESLRLMVSPVADRLWPTHRPFLHAAVLDRAVVRALAPRTIGRVSVTVALHPFVRPLLPSELARRLAYPGFPPPRSWTPLDRPTLKGRVKLWLPAALVGAARGLGHAQVAIRPSRRRHVGAANQARRDDPHVA